jgi:hypothetical protein
MSISIVNGFFCTCPCDVAKAKKCENPHPSTDPGNLKAVRNSAASDVRRSDQPAVVFGGALSGLNGVPSVAAASPSVSAALSNSVIDLLA